MAPGTPHTALLVFSLSAWQEAGRKQPFGAQRQKAGQQFFQQLIDHTEALARQSGLELIWVGEEQQQGENFGARFTHAIESVFARGYQRLIAIGSDSPDLSPQLLQDAITALNQGQMVLGPALDGGAYLIGLHRRHFEAASFEALPWSQPWLYRALLEWGQAQGLSAHPLRPLADIDDFRSLKHYLALRPLSRWTRLAQRLLQRAAFAPPQPPLGLPAWLIGYLHPLRGPPTSDS